MLFDGSSSSFTSFGGVLCCFPIVTISVCGGVSFYVLWWCSLTRRTVRAMSKVVVMFIFRWVG